jgi:type VI secretion system secreted protein VgrG
MAGTVYKQKDLACQVVTRPPGFGEDDLLVSRLECTERISQPFRIQLELRSPKDDLDFLKIVGSTLGLSIEVDRESKRKRLFHGYVARFAQGESGESLTTYQAEVVPWLSLLERRSDSRIFQNKSVLEIAEQVFVDAGFSGAFEKKTKASYPKLEYCVQYRETDFHFVSRLLEEEGIAYWFRYEQDKHVLVLTDDKSGHPLAVKEKLEFAEKEGRKAGADDRWGRSAWISAWQAERQVRTGKWTVKDFDFANPETSLEQEKAGGAATLARFDYPTRHVDAKRAEARALLRMQIEEAQAEQHGGQGSCLEFIAGTRFSLDGHNRESFKAEYLLTSVTHKLRQAVRPNEGGTTYENSFSALPAATPFRAPLATPRPLVHGVQTAIVTGPSGEEIYVDEHGRVKVQFHWDRAGKKDENTTCWVRVAQTHASGGFGGAFWPRIGDEVVVSFEEGDPDHPLITGRVYNGKNKPPYKLPDQMTKATLKTRSTKGGSEKTFNEIRFEDKKGEEHLFLHAEKDRHERTKNNLHALVEGEHHVKVVKDEYALVEGKRHAEVKGEQVEKIGGNHHVNVGMNRHAKVGQNEAVDAGMQIHLKAGMTVVIEAGMQLTLKAGSGFITIGMDGVSISGPMVKINSGGAAGSGSGASPGSPTAPKDGLKE